MALQQKLQIDLNSMSEEELREFIKHAKRILAIRRFEDEMQQAVNEFQNRDPRVIHL